MSKSFLRRTFEGIQANTYRWNLYFFKIDRRNENPYYVYKHTFKNTDYLPNYLMALRDTVIKYQIDSLESVQDYDGQNSKTSCDKLSVTNELISTQWDYLSSSVAGAPRDMIQGKYQGYLLDGQPLVDGLPSVVIVKVGNPIINLGKKNSKVFKHTPEDELEDITDELCRLYLIADFVVIGDILYSFNLKFEEIFRMQKTLSRLKNQAIEQIMDTNAFRNPEQVRNFMKSYTSPKTFLTLREQRVEKLKSAEGRTEISELLNLQVINKEIAVEGQEQASQLIKYLCYKIFQDKETDNLIEVTSVVNDNVQVRN